MKVHLRKRKLIKKGSGKPRYTLYLDIYYAKRKKRKEFLGIYLIMTPSESDYCRNGI